MPGNQFTDRGPDRRLKVGAFLMPSHPPETSVRAGQRSDLGELEMVDSLGFDEAWVGEHYTSRWEPCPAPDLLIAQALARTTRLRLGPLGHLLPYHNPVELAHRVAYLDHMAEGRYQVGVGISALPTDHEIFGLDVSGGRNRRMTFESLDIMTQLWTEGPRDFTGEFWSSGQPQPSIDGLGYHLVPYQRPHPPVAIAAMTAGSENHKLAGEKGYLPVSMTISPDLTELGGHWRAVEEGAARSGRTPDRGNWRIIRDVYVAPTDSQARALAINGTMGRCWREFLLPLYHRLGLGARLKLDRATPDAVADLDYLADNLWLVGSPATVADRIADLQRITGGFGYLVINSYAAASEAERRAWHQSLHLLTDEVLPLCHRRGDDNRAASLAAHQ